MNQKQPNSLLYFTASEKGKPIFMSLLIEFHSGHMRWFRERKKKRGKFVMSFTAYFINTIVFFFFLKKTSPSLILFGRIAQHQKKKSPKQN